MLCPPGPNAAHPRRPAPGQGGRRTAPPGPRRRRAWRASPRSRACAWRSRRQPSVSPCEVVPAEPPPAEEDEHPADPGPHQEPEPLAHGGDSAARPAREELEREHGRYHDGEYGDGEDTSRHDDHRRTSAQPTSTHSRNAALLMRCGPSSGLIRSVSDGCQGSELSLYAEASH